MSLFFHFKKSFPNGKQESNVGSTVVDIKQPFSVYPKSRKG